MTDPLSPRQREIWEWLAQQPEGATRRDVSFRFGIGESTASTHLRAMRDVGMARYDSPISSPKGRWHADAAAPAVEWRWGRVASVWELGRLA